MKRPVIVLLCGLALAGCEEKVKPTIVPVASKELPSQESWNSTVVFSDSAQLKAVLWSGHISAFASRQVTELADSIHVDGDWEIFAHGMFCHLCPELPCGCLVKEGELKFLFLLQ